MRLGGVNKGEPIWTYVAPGMFIAVEDLAATSVDIAVSGEAETYVENAELRRRGKEALEVLPMA